MATYNKVKATFQLPPKKVRLIKESGFTAGMLKGALADGRKNNEIFKR